MNIPLLRYWPLISGDSKNNESSEIRTEQVGIFMNDTYRLNYELFSGDQYVYVCNISLKLKLRESINLNKKQFKK